MAAGGHKNIRRFDIPVHDALHVSGIQRVRHFDADLQQLLQVHGAPADAVLERGPVHELHGDEGMAGVFADFVDGADVGVIERGGRAGLTAEALEGHRIARQFQREEFQGSEPAEGNVLRLVHHAHAAAA